MDGCDCSTSEPKPLKPVDEALDFILSQANAISETETIACKDALGRVLATPVKSLVNVPPWNNSAMDGYVFKHADIQSDTPLKISQRIPAGYTGKALEAGTVARIFTGAPIPADADTVVMQEHCLAEGDFVTINKLPTCGANVRMAGEDVCLDQIVIESGTQLEPQHLGMAASVGIAQLTVYRRLKVAVFSSGDELIMPGNPLAAGQIYNSNQFTLCGLLESLNCEVINLGIVEDTFDATCDALSDAAKQADLILASGGVSVGEEDHVKPAVEKLGQLNLWKIALRPGKPLAFGHIDDVPFLGAPGNPVSLFVTFCIFARPFIKKMQGMEKAIKPVMIQASADFDWMRPDSRREYARGHLSVGENSEAKVSVFPSRSSGVLSSVTWANGLIVIAENETFNKGEKINFIPFSELLR